MHQIYVLYHASCTDGTGAKYAAWKRLKDAAEYIPVQYGRPLPELKPNSRIFIVDFSYPKDVLDGLRSVHAEVVILDHHKTAEEALRGYPDAVFDMNKSGAVLSWEYFNPNEEIPQLLLNIQDRDLWRFEVSFSEEVHAGLQLLEGNMHLWHKCTEETGYGNLLDKGTILMRRTEIEVKNSVKKVKIVPFLGYKCGIINTTDYQSEIGNAICEDRNLNVDFAAPYTITNRDEVLLSLRSVGDFDVSVIAKKFGGGGHKNAAGCRITLPQLIDLTSGRMT